MNIVDAILAILILIPAYLGFQKGFLRGIFSLIGIIIGIILAVKFHGVIVPFINVLHLSAQLTSLISFLIILIIIYYIILFIAGRISKINKVTRTIDKISGLFLGFLKGLLLASLFAICFNTFGIFSDSKLSSSFLYPKLNNIAPAVYNYLNGMFSDVKSPVNFNNFLNLDTLIKK